jgi:DNA-binding LacI/PurR family transcriptional regulator
LNDQLRCIGKEADMAGKGTRSDRATIESVAARAGVSRQTVSNALNAPEKLRAETLQRVLGAIDELGYRPSHAARSLRMQASRVLGYRLQLDTPAGGVHDRFLHALCSAARDRRYDVLAFAARTDDEEIATYEELMRRDSVDGFVLVGTHFVDPRINWLLTRGAEFVAFGRPWGLRRVRHSWVDVDGAAGTEEAVAHLVSLGHRRIGYLGWPDGSGVGDDRRAGWLRAATARRLPVRGLLAVGEDGVATGAALARRLIESGAPPTALVCVSDAMALGAMHWLDDQGIKPGRDVAVVGFDDSPVADLVRPTLTSVRQPLEAVAEKVVEILLEHLAGARTKPARVLIKPALAVRASTAP